MATMAELKKEHKERLQRVAKRQALRADLVATERRMFDSSIEKWQRRAEYPRYVALSVAHAQVTPHSPSLLMNPWY